MPAAEDISKETILFRRHAHFLFGLGLIEAIPEKVILANADPHDRNGVGISGRAAMQGIHVSRFGSQAHEASIFMFLADAL